MSRKWCVAVLVAATMLIAAPAVVASAQTRIGLNGGRPSEWPFLSSVLAGQGLTQTGWLAFASHVGENWLPGTTPVPLDYPGQLGVVSGPNAMTANQSTAVGQQLLHNAILDNLKDGPVAVAGLSEGTLVIDKELAYLATLSKADAPPPDALTFYVFGDMLRGLGQMYLKGMTIPFIGQTFGPVPETQYATSVVNEQWDGWANPPDRPWNVLADLNAVMGAVYTVNGTNDHSQTSVDSLADAVKVSEIANSLGGTTTTYIVPRQQLPLTKPLLQLGVPKWVVDKIDKLLMPLIQTGYSSLTPNLGPHIAHGQLVFTSPGPITEPMSTVKQLDMASAQAASTTAKTDAVPAPTSPAATSSRRATAVDGGSSLARHPLADATKAGGSRQNDPEPAAVSPPPVTSGDGSADASTSAAVDHPTGAADAGGSVKPDPETGVTQRTRPARVSGSANSDSTPGVHGRAKPGGADAGATGADTSPKAASAA